MPTLVVEDGVARVTALAAPWVPVEELRLVVDGHIVARGPADEPLSWDRAGDEDYWILAEAGWPPELALPADFGDYSVVAPGYVPIGFTSPVFVDADGDGTWTAPGLR